MASASCACTTWRSGANPPSSRRGARLPGLTEALTTLGAQGVPDEVYERVRTQLSEKEISDLSFAIMSINGWNRLNVGFRTVPGSADKAYGLDKAKFN